MRLNVTFGLLGVVSGLLAVGALFLAVLSIRVAYSCGGGFVDVPGGVWAVFGLWNLFISLIAAWVAFVCWRALSNRIRRSPDRT